MSGTRIVLIALVALGVIFFLGIGVGIGRKDGGDVDLNASWLGNIGKLLVREQALTTGDIEGADPDSCLQSDTLVIASGRQCTYKIRAAASGVRKLNPRRSSGAQITLTLQQKQALDLKQTLQGTVPAEVWDVYTDPATLTIACGGSNPCKLTLQ